MNKCSMYTVVSVFKTTLNFISEAVVIVCQTAVSFDNADNVRCSSQHCSNTRVTFFFYFREILFEN